MNTPGVLRKIDDLGRVVIPSELRKALQLKSGDLLELRAEEDRLVLKKFTPGCIFCGSIHSLVRYEGKDVCANCIRILKNV